MKYVCDVATRPDVGSYGDKNHVVGMVALPKHVEVSGERLLVIDEIQATFAIPRSKNAF